eukprot:CAMPEP_0206140458 /NCGR_PEP_ID=MMETSP1473-20131121/9531_1 /ASSEMBLY_ACC=CAM_ASM_001109 /TAXON_ID=1461547 /ORGANISM="Stichococcus sp, Strain RCC1054" /LENGTH=615 /DNA_ID=CAMNT_0053534611 /DNA_START=553 /DNA_END=2400 /DNA_ORIENTATION=+
MAPRWAKRWAPQGERFTSGYTDAKYVMVAVSVVGEVLQSGLVFGWNALALMLQARDNFAGKCTDPSEISGSGTCKSQESSLAVLWTLGIFALNFGPVLVGPTLDGLGPKWTSVIGCVLNMVGMIFLGVSHTAGGVNLLHPGAILIGLGGITFHLAQFHISGLFPRQRGLISSLFVAGFTGAGIIFYILERIFEDLGGSQAAYRGVLLVYGIVFCGGYIPVMLYFMPNEPFMVGQVYLFGQSWKPVTRLRTEVELRVQEATDLAHPPPSLSAVDSFGDIELSGNGHSKSTVDVAGLVTGTLSSDDPRWQDDGPKASNGGAANGRAANGAATFSDIDLDGATPAKGDGEASGRAGSQSGSDNEPVSPSNPNVHPPLTTGVVWGPLVFEPRRFVELRKKDFFTQALSAESLGMGLFYTLNVFWIQFYLGTTRLQLQYKGDTNYTYTDLANILPCAGILTLPIVSWLLDKKGYGITLGTINALSVLTSALQAIPNLQVQAVTLVVWTVARFFLYSSYFTIFGVLFGFKNFGKMVAIDNTVNGLIGLLQLPVSWLGIRHLNGNFTAINISQIIILMPVFIFCWMMHKWSSENLVPIRPMEGEQLPDNMVPPKRKATGRPY